MSDNEKLNRRLLNACRYGNVMEVKVLAKKGADITFEDLDDPFQCTPLSEACRCGNASVVQLLLSMGADPNEPISHGITPIHLACERGHCDVLQILLKNNAINSNYNNNNNNNHQNYNDKIIANNNNSNINDDSNGNNINGIITNPMPAELFNLDTPLHVAAANDRSNICRMLVTMGGNEVNINVQNRTGDTPLHVAVANDRYETVKVLLQLGSDITIKNFGGMSAYSLAKVGKCKQSLSAMRPFIAQLKLRDKQEKQRKLTEKISKKRTMTMQHYMSMSGHNLDDMYNEEKALTLADEIDDTSMYDDTNQMTASISFVSSAKRQSNIVFKHGWLIKQGYTFKTFHRRYFVLFSNGELKYYTSRIISRDNKPLYYDPSSPKFNIFMNDGNLVNGNNSNNNNNGNNGYNGNNNNQFDDAKSDESNSIENDSSNNGNNINSKAISLITPKMDENTQQEGTVRKKSKSKLKILRPRGVIDCNSMIETQFLEFDEHGVFGFAVITSNRTWKFKARSDSERREWIASIHAVNYGVSAFDFGKLSLDISQTGSTTVFRRSQNSFLSDTTSIASSNDRLLENDGNQASAVQEGWIYKLGSAIRGLEQNYWKKRWISLYQNPPRLVYAQYPTDFKLIQKTLKLNLNLDLKAPNDDINVNTDIVGKNNGNNKNNNDDLLNDSNVNVNVKNNGIGNNNLINEENFNPITSIFHTFAQNEEMRTKLANGTYYVKGKIMLSYVIDMDYIQDKELIHNRYQAPTIHVFSLKTVTPNRVWIFACESKEEVQLWMERIKYFIPDWKIKQKLDKKFKKYDFNNNNKNTNSNDNDTINNNGTNVLLDPSSHASPHSSPHSSPVKVNDTNIEETQSDIRNANQPTSMPAASSKSVILEKNNNNNISSNGNSNSNNSVKNNRKNELLLLDSGDNGQKSRNSNDDKTVITQSEINNGNNLENKSVNKMNKVNTSNHKYSNSDNLNDSVEKLMTRIGRKVLRKVSDACVTVGIKEQHSAIVTIHPRGTTKFTDEDVQGP